jgi:biopolymer transport protein ExbD
VNRPLKIEQPAARSQPENTLPMINVVFLLLIFFMLAGAFKRPELLPVILPEAQGLQEFQREELLLLVGAEGKIAFDGQLLSLEQLGAQIALHQEQLQASGLQLKADADLDSQRLLDVVEVLAEQGITSVKLMAERFE